MSSKLFHFFKDKFIMAVKFLSAASCCLKDAEQKLPAASWSGTEKALRVPRVESSRFEHAQDRHNHKHNWAEQQNLEQWTEKDGESGSKQHIVADADW